ncbi:outer envelope 80, chloroplastic-like isoform X2 [Olea europaea subsp. europaea]|uniref:Outer envelope 80, chloroplastic-like isoform X2 n=1 Tax=Olea europaea subsp. europaea TaxID=158383 RepID=A0A8S0T8L0_OLEEU|nr:outer envelope 80, chloroplastic-like isoform X2 [Olea europaea subsp. europaea]
MDQGIPVSPEWLIFNRVNARTRQGWIVGPACLLFRHALFVFILSFHWNHEEVMGVFCKSARSFSGGHVVGKFPPHEAFAIGGTNSVRGYEEGAVGSGRTFVVGSGEISFPLVLMVGPVEGVIFADYGSDLGSGSSVPVISFPVWLRRNNSLGCDPAGARKKPGSGYGYGVSIRVDSPLGPLRLEYASNDQRNGRFHFGIGPRN